MVRLVTALSILLLAGCGTAGSSSTLADMNQRYHGTNAEDFFLSYGRPANEKTLNGGGRTYRWVSIDQAEHMSATEFHNVPVAGGFVPLAQTGAPVEVPLYCELTIQTDNNDRIQSLAIIGDSAGKFSNSHCRDIFSVK